MIRMKVGQYAQIEQKLLALQERKKTAVYEVDDEHPTPLVIASLMHQEKELIGVLKNCRLGDFLPSIGNLLEELLDVINGPHLKERKFYLGPDLTLEALPPVVLHW